MNTVNSQSTVPASVRWHSSGAAHANALKRQLTKWCAGLSLFVVTSAAWSSINNPLLNATASEIALRYGSTQHYQITRNGKTIGQHKLSFDVTGDKLQVTINSAIKVRIFKIPVYSLTYSATETWRGNQLLEATATTVENGDMSQVSLDNSDNASPILYASNHWHPGVLTDSLVFNTLTGENDKLSVTEIGLDTVHTETAAVPAMRYRYSGDLQLDVWYDTDGLWIKMAFTGEDGSSIQYLRTS